MFRSWFRRNRQVSPARPHRAPRRRPLATRLETLESRRVCAADFNNDGFDDLVLGLAAYDSLGLLESGAILISYGAAGGLPAAATTFNEADFGGVVTPGNYFGFAITTGDFDGNGWDDLAISAIGLDTAAVDAGGVYVVYSTPVAGGLDFTTVELWTQDTAGVFDACEAGDNFGATLTTGDYNADGYDDLVIGSPSEDIGAAVDAGAVNTINGSIVGLGAAYGYWFQDAIGIADVSEGGDSFGASLATGDYNGDGRDDLAIGVPREDVGLILDAGAINVIYSVGPGLGAAGNQFLHQNSPFVPDASEPVDLFGTALAAGDFDMNGADDLAVGVPQEDLGAVVDAGAVNVLYGGGLGLGLFQQFWTQDTPGVLDVAEADDFFGGSLATADFDGDGDLDLAIGVWKEDLLAVNAGAVNVLYARPGGLSAINNQFWAQGLGGILDAQEVDDFFGAELSTGDYDGDGFADLTVGTPGEDILLTPDAGAVHDIYGAGFGLNALGNDFWNSLIGALALETGAGYGKSVRR